jgi:glyoxylase-like metal-dependent hydrolase (beta-lactamase superfamily II)
MAAVSIPYVREMQFEYGEAQRVSPLIRRLVAKNPGAFTLYGTGVYIIGEGEVAVIDPGPNNEEHIANLFRALEGERVTHIFVTHGHLDHSPAAKPLSQKTGAKIYGSGIPTVHSFTEVRMEAGDDFNFKPDIAAKDGERFSGPGWTIEAVLTPGHTSNHAAYALLEENALFTGDHIMGWSTTVISPPDGDMNAYLASLDKVRARDFTTLWPTHGPPIRETAPFIDAYRAHRMNREAQIVARLKAGDTKIADMVEVMYADVDRGLHPAARHSVLAHMIRLVKLGVVKTEGEPEVDSDYRLAA